MERRARNHSPGPTELVCIRPTAFNLFIMTQSFQPNKQKKLFKTSSPEGEVYLTHEQSQNPSVPPYLGQLFFLIFHTYCPKHFSKEVPQCAVVTAQRARFTLQDTQQQLNQTATPPTPTKQAARGAADVCSSVFQHFPTLLPQGLTSINIPLVPEGSAETKSTRSSGKPTPAFSPHASWDSRLEPPL